jgi:hypothetical protein
LNCGLALSGTTSTVLGSAADKSKRRNDD